MDRRLFFGPISEHLLTGMKWLLHWALGLTLVLKRLLAGFERLHLGMMGVTSSADCDTKAT